MVELLTLTAELSVGIAGFTAVFSVLGQRESVAPDRMQRHRVRQMLIMSLATALASLLPIWLTGMSAASEIVWRLSGGICVAVAASLMIHIEGLNRRGGFRQLPGYSRPNALFMWTSGFAVLFLYALSAIMSSDAVAEKCYTSAVVLSLVMAGVQFVRAALRQLVAADVSTEGGGKGAA